MSENRMGDYPPGVTGKDIDRLEGLPFSDPPECCGTCRDFNGDFCTKLWNNLDECYKDTERDERSLTDWCEDWEYDENAAEAFMEDIMEEMEGKKE